MTLYCLNLVTKTLFIFKKNYFLSFVDLFNHVIHVFGTRNIPSRKILVCDGGFLEKAGEILYVFDTPVFDWAVCVCTEKVVCHGRSQLVPIDWKAILRTWLSARHSAWCNRYAWY